jgi:hypothetical protein
MMAECPYCGRALSPPVEWEDEQVVACNPCERVFKYPLQKIKKKREVNG